MKIHQVTRFCPVDGSTLYTEEDECTFREYINYVFGRRPYNPSTQPFDIVVPYGSDTLHNAMIRSACGKYWDETSHDTADEKIEYGVFTIAYMLCYAVDAVSFFADYSAHPHVIIEMTKDIYYVCKEKEYKKIDRDTHKSCVISKEEAINARATLLSQDILPYKIAPHERTSVIKAFASWLEIAQTHDDAVFATKQKNWKESFEKDGQSFYFEALVAHASTFSSLSHVNAVVKM